MNSPTFQLYAPFTNYSINIYGDVFRNNKKITPWLSAKGYKMISLWVNNKQYNKSIHRLLGITFIPKSANANQIDHIDRNKLNNCLSNLRWVDGTQNCINKEYIYNPKTNSKGISMSKSGTRYCVNLYRKGKKMYKGSYISLLEAKERYKQVVEQWDLEYNST